MLMRRSEAVLTTLKENKFDERGDNPEERCKLKVFH